MTRILACSDIHNNVNAVRQLRAREGNDYDALIVAGDIGSETADEIFEVFESFDCAVLYIFGNWDHRLEHNKTFGERCHHVHLSPFRIGELSVVGETIDGIDPDWEVLRPDIEGADADIISTARQAFSARQRAKLSAIVEAEGPERTIVVSHYRLTKTQSYLPGVPLFLFGHIHRFEDSTFRGQRFVNVSALDNRVMVVPRGLKRIKRSDYRLLNDGSYVVITHGRDTGFSVEPRRFDPDFSNWDRIEGLVDRSATEVEGI
ncbi:hypothetical protein E0H47_27565 [Rhizobium leguminosarum bv. viciae]|uniref:metallophosphoesterase family protein n=1 Tax=Rhizobium leguminosarum TaxID=384 RepID=UPI00103760E2|nr:metallophosphoesterase family protein [Rhizobium leguminosarum]TBG89370.1 hypothetical protein ELG67_09845 [Rhizobium leguminosarum]TBZ33428.1 hypothetical protein E0H47_27565 [Rhizobium leguminosarum bv. viciae]